MKRGKFCWHWQLRKILHFFLFLLLLCLAKSGYFCKTKDPRSKMIDRKKRNILTYNGNQKLEDTRIIYHATLRSQIEGYTRLLIFRKFSTLPDVLLASPPRGPVY